MARLGRGCIEGCGRLRICPGCSSVTRCRKSDAAMLPAVSCHSNPPKHALLPPSFVSAPPSLASPPRCPTHKTCCTTPKSLHMLLKGCSSPQGRKGGRGGNPPPQAIIPTCFTGKVPTLDPGASHPTVPSPEMRHRRAGQPDLGVEAPLAALPVELWQAGMLQHRCLLRGCDTQPLPRPDHHNTAAYRSESPMSSFCLLAAPGLMEMEVPDSSCCRLAGRHLLSLCSSVLAHFHFRQVCSASPNLTVA